MGLEWAFPVDIGLELAIQEEKAWGCIRRIVLPFFAEAFGVMDALDAPHELWFEFSVTCLDGEEKSPEFSWVAVSNCRMPIHG